tara:strand:+ start:430 stop:786 length:357 start_codon:yes stop_codon:yes gene_type:complete
MKNYTKYLGVVCLISVLPGCEVLSMISSVMPSSGISADLQVGDDTNSLSKTNNSIGDIEAEDNSVVNLSTSTSDSRIDSAENVNISEESPWWVYLLIIIPWFIISPQDIIRKFKNRKK